MEEAKILFLELSRRQPANLKSLKSHTICMLIPEG